MRLTLGSSPASAIDEADPLPPDDARLAPVALDQLYRSQRPGLLRFLGNRNSGSDLVQQLFCRIAGGPLPTMRSPDAYLRHAARNLARDEARAAARQGSHVQVCEETAPLHAPDQLAALEARDVLRRLDQLLARLPVRTREIFLAHRIDGYTYGEIAARTGLSVKTVEKHMSRAIGHLGRYMPR